MAALRCRRSTLFRPLRPLLLFSRPSAVSLPRPLPPTLPPPPHTPPHPPAVQGRLVVLGGAFNVNGNVNPAAEANVFGDPDAANVVFSRCGCCTGVQ